MKQLFLRIWIFFCLWGRMDPWMENEQIDAVFAWELAGILAEHDDDLRQWEVLK